MTSGDSSGMLLELEEDVKDVSDGDCIRMDPATC